jgi:hypothetical protein
MISLVFCWMAPWRECELCFIGPAVLYDGDEITLSLGLFFIEFGITVRRRGEL